MRVAYGSKKFSASGPFPKKFEIIQGKSANPSIKIFFDQSFRYNNETESGSGFFYCCVGRWGANLTLCDSGGFSWSQLPRISITEVSPKDNSISVRLSMKLCPEKEVGGFPYWFGYAFNNLPFGETNFNANIYGDGENFLYPASLWR